MPKVQYIVVSCAGGHFSFYKETGFGFRVFGRREEAIRMPFAQALKLENHRTFAIKETLLDAWLADPPKRVREILEKQHSLANRRGSLPPQLKGG